MERNVLKVLLYTNWYTVYKLQNIASKQMYV